MNTWIAIGATALGCYAVKLAGLLVPAGALERPLVMRLAALLPVALLAALTAQQTFADGIVVRDAVDGLARAAAIGRSGNGRVRSGLLDAGGHGHQPVDAGTAVQRHRPHLVAVHDVTDGGSLRLDNWRGGLHLNS